MYTKNNYAFQKLCTDEKQNCAFVNLCELQFLHLENNLRCRFAHFVHDGFSHICRFAFYTFAHLQKVANMREMFLHLCTVCENVFENVRTCEFSFFCIFVEICKFEQNLSKCRKSRNFRKCPENVRKKLTCS